MQRNWNSFLRGYGSALNLFPIRQSGLAIGANVLPASNDDALVEVWQSVGDVLHDAIQTLAPTGTNINGEARSAAGDGSDVQTPAVLAATRG